MVLAYGFLLMAGADTNTAFFSVLNGILLRPLAYEQPERLMTVWESNPQQGLGQDRVSGGTYEDWRRTSQTFEEMAAYSYGGRVLGTEDEPVRVASSMSYTLSLHTYFPGLGNL